MRQSYYLWCLLGIIAIGCIVLLICGIDGEVKGILGVITGTVIKTVLDNKGGRK